MHNSEPMNIDCLRTSFPFPRAKIEAEVGLECECGVVACIRPAKLESLDASHWWRQGGTVLEMASTCLSLTG